MNTIFTRMLGVTALALALPCCSDKTGDAGVEAAYKEQQAQPAQSSQPAADVNSWEEIRRSPLEKSADFRADLSSRLEDLERKMEPLAARVGDQWAAINAELAEKRDALSAQIESLAAATADTWEKARDETVALYVNLRDAIARAANEPGQ